MPKLVLVPNKRPTVDRGGRPAVISREKVLEVARLLSSDDLNMNTVAERLGVQRASLYYHFRSRQDLLAALAEEFIRDLKVPAPDPGRWRAWLEQVIGDFFALLDSHPVFLQLENFTHIFRAGVLLQENAMATLVGAGFEVDEAARIWRIFTSHVYVAASNAHQSRVVDTAKFAAEALQFLNDAEQTQAMPYMRALLQKIPELDPRKRLAADVAWHLRMLPEPKPSTSTRGTQG